MVSHGCGHIITQPSICLYAGARAILGSGPQDPSAAAAVSEPWHPRLAALWDEAELCRTAQLAGFGDGRFGKALAKLAGSTGAVEEGDGAGEAPPSKKAKVQP